MDIATHPHARRYRAWFKHLDADGNGRISGAQAKEILPRSRLPQHKLASIWQLAGQDGYLELDSFIKACELISLAQSGSEISDKAWLTQLKSGIEPPRMDGLDAECGVDTTAEENPFGSATSPSSRGFASKLTFKRRSINDVSSLIDGLKEIYLGRIKPIEEAYHFQRFHSPCLGPADFSAKPCVLLLGQYSTGKTTFVKTLLGREYPGCNIGPEPTTDRFTVVMHGYEDRQIPGNTLTVSPELPYQTLHHFGTGLLSRLEGAQCNASLLHSVSLIDSPGVLSGEKQRIERGYNFVKVCQWFATRSDIILLLFDPHKLDISDEFKAVIASMGGNEEKLRVCLNKADTIDQQQLLRVYGALMWSLGKVVKSPEVSRVYVGSFNGGSPVRTDVNPNCKALFEAEQTDLMEELKRLPGKSCDRKVNEVVKRIRALKVHLLLLQHLKKQMPALLKKQKKQAKIIQNMPDHFRTVQSQNHLATADFPNVDAFADILESFGFEKISKVQDKHVRTVDEALSVDIPKLVRQFSDPYNDTK